MTGRPLVCIFVGPSLPAEDARAALRVVGVEPWVLPPVEQGDLLRLLAARPEVVGILDGYFFHRPAVLHREILLAMERGVYVLGASSAGALRAAELDVHGMEGIGEIYRWYKRGRIDGDDEVAVLHADEQLGFRPMTDALVNIRHNLGRARRRGIVSPETAAAVLASARRLHFTRRTYAAAVDQAGADGGRRHELEALRRFLQREAVDLKRQDALGLLRVIAERIGGIQPWPSRPALQVQRITHFRRHQREYTGQIVWGRQIPDELVVSFERLLSPSFPRLQRRLRLRCLALDQARHLGLSPTEPEALLASFGRRVGWTSEAARAAWLDERCLSEAELAATLRERDLEGRVLDLYRARTGGGAGRAALFRRIVGDVAVRLGTSEQALAGPPLLWPGVEWTGPLRRELKLRGRFRPALQRADRILRHNAELVERDPSREPSSLGPAIVARFLAGRWGVQEVQVWVHARGLGFASQTQLLEAARQVCIYEAAGLPSQEA